MSEKNSMVVTRWRLNAVSLAVILGFSGMTNVSRADPASAVSNVPPRIANTSASGEIKRDATNQQTDQKNSSVVFRKKNRVVNKTVNCSNNNSCGTQQMVTRPRRPVGSTTGVGVSANNNGQAAKANVKIPF